MKLINQEVRRRDGFSCFVCGGRGGGLHVHHLESWAACRELRYLAANLITLCGECHSQFHALYGQVTDLEDFEDFARLELIQAPGRGRKGASGFVCDRLPWEDAT